MMLSVSYYPKVFPLPPSMKGGWRNVTEEGGSDAGNYIPFLTISHQTGAFVEDVLRIKRHPLVPSYIPVYGYVYDVKWGKLVEVPEATKAGRAK